MEAELQDLDADEAQEYLESLGVKEGGLRSLIAATYKQLGLLTYFTTGSSCQFVAHTGWLCALQLDARLDL